MKITSLIEAIWRVGPDGRTIFALGKKAADDELIGIMDTEELARCVVNRHNDSTFSMGGDIMFYRAGIVADYLEEIMYEENGSKYINGHRLESLGSNSNRWVIRTLRNRKSGWVGLKWVLSKLDEWEVEISDLDQWCQENGKEPPLEIQVQN